MKAVAVYRHSQKGSKSVKTGFSWPAFFFLWIWAFTKGLIGIGALLLILWLTIHGLYLFARMSALDHTGITYICVLLATATFVGLSGNKWYRNSLIKQGYKLANRAPTNSAKAADYEAKSAAHTKDPAAQQTGSITIS